MPNDVESMFASLSDDAGLARIDGPEVLRRRSDRRAVGRSVATVAAAAVLVAGVAVGTRLVLADQAAPRPVPADSSAPVVVVPTTPPVTATTTPPVTSSAPAATSSSPAVHRPPIPGSVPTRAFLSRADFNAVETPHDQSDSAVLPDLCGATYRTGDVGVRDKRHAPYRGKGDGADVTPLASLDQTITVFRERGAQRYLDELRAAVADCPSQKRGRDIVKYRLLTPADAGDESLLIEMSEPSRGDVGELDPDGSRSYDYCAVVRVGDTVTTLWATGWESQSPNRSELGGFAVRAAQRLQDWRG
jgi:hypothetical protein